MKATIGVRVLGPLRMWRGPDEIALGSPQQRAVLTALVMGRGAPISIPELIDAVWGIDPPASAAGVVRTYLSRMRRSLDPADRPTRPLIRSSGRGYTLDLEPGQLDLGTFERLVAQARQARRAGDLDTASADLREALALWTGDPLDGVPGPAAEQHRRALEVSRSAVTLERLEVELDLSRHAEMIAELRSLTAGDPLNERLRELLMLALYRCGRQADALAVYQDCRRLLADELGVDPGPGLQSRQQQILRNDPSLAPPEPFSGVIIFRKPAQLPAGVSTFIGRTDELNRALDRLGPQTRTAVAVIGGMAGIGKTTLALHLAHRLAADFEDGQLYADLRGFDPDREPADPAAVLGSFLQALGVTADAVPLSLDARAAALRTRLAGRRVLMVLDNARDVPQVRPLLPGTPGCLVIVTSRNTLPALLAVDGAEYLPLDLPTPDEALAFLTERLGPARVEAEHPAARAIVERCGRLPLALAVVAARAALNPTFKLAAVATQLASVTSSLDALEGGDPTVDVRAVFSWSYRSLSPAAARAFRLLSLHPGPDVGVAAAADILGLSRSQAGRCLAELTAARLLAEAVPGRFTAHDLLRAYGTELAREHDPASERRTAVHRLLEHYRHTALACAIQVTPSKSRIVLSPPFPGGPFPAGPAGGGAEPQDAVAWFITEHPVLLAAIEQAHAEGFDAHTWQLEWAVRDFLNRQGLWHQLVVVQRVALAAARRLGDRVAEAHVQRGIALMDANMGHFDSARQRILNAVATFEQTDHQLARADTLRQMSWLLNLAGDYAGSLTYARDSLDVYRTLGDPALQASALHAVGCAYIQLQRYPDALIYAQEALALAGGLGQYAQADAWHTLGYAQHHLGLYREARVSYEQAVDRCRALGMHHLEAETWRCLTGTHLAAGHDDLARQTRAEALRCLDGLDHPLATEVRISLGNGRAAPGERTQPLHLTWR